MKNLLYITAAFLTVTFLYAGVALSAAQSSDSVIARVCILDGEKSVRIELDSRYKMYSMDSGEVVMEGPYLKANVAPAEKGITVNKKKVKANGIRIEVLKDSNIYINAKRFRGEVDIVRKDKSSLLVINHIPVETYLYGVLYNEVSHRWPMEILKAQAIVARTFAYHQIEHNKKRLYDLRSDIYSQVYHGKSSEKWSTTTAVNLTRDKVLVYDGKIFPAYYHATCAGYTEDASNLWAIDIPPLDGVKCGYCGNSPHNSWRCDIPLWELEGKLRDNGYKIGRIVSFKPVSVNRSGRNEKAEIKDKDGIAIIMTAKDFRNIIGPNKVKSTKFGASIEWGHVILYGWGWGHGVGMCQWGAYQMAVDHKSTEEILRYYYPGSEIATIDKVKL